MSAPTTPAVRPCAVTDLFTIHEAPPDVLAALDAYFAQFAAPAGVTTPGLIFGAHACLCGAPLTGFLGTFTWGIAYGEGFCRDCKRPGRAHHVVRDAEGVEVLRLSEYVLMYLPRTDETAHTQRALNGEAA